MAPIRSLAIDRRRLLIGSSTAILASALPTIAWSASASPFRGARLVRLLDADNAIVSLDGKSVTLGRNQRSGDWTLVELIDGGDPFVVLLENFDDLHAPMLLVNRKGVRARLNKTAELTSLEIPSPYFGHSWRMLRTVRPTSLAGKS